MYFIVIGCGRVGAQLAGFLSQEHNVVVVDASAASLESLGPVFNGATVVGNAMSLDVLREAGIERCDAVAAVTGNGNANIVIGQIAKKIFNVRKAIIRIIEPEKSDLYRTLGYEVINGTGLVAAFIRDKLLKATFSTCLLETDRVSFVEAAVGSRWAGRRVSEMSVPGVFHVVVLMRRGEPVIAEDSSVIQEGDLAVCIARPKDAAGARAAIEAV